MKSGKIGVQMFNLKNKIEELGVYETMKKIHELGYRYVEVTQVQMTEENVSELRRASLDFNIKVAAISAPLDSMPGSQGESLTADFDKIVSDCITLDCNFIRIGMMPVNLMGDKIKAMEYITEAEKMAERLKQHGIELYYHNHHIEFEKYDGKCLLDIMREQTSNLGFELDVHWAQRGGANPIDVINRFAGRVSLIHLKDYRIGPIDLGDLRDMSDFMSKFTGNIEFAELGTGNLDIKGIMEAGMKAGVQYFLIEQDDTYGRDPFDCLKDSGDYLRQLGYADLF
ncbi:MULTISPECIES: sugar phosphate isomerase/epimerase [unclassified Niallia]|uniref:sugar phosphate isomerase/epimerase family protein n=1 Tax=unclassified Niallia TaxID=2837522 RepID=UPI001EDA1208|nr:MULTISPECIES: sugar phosphate isomerase/epimerase [unclassified Niallia]MCM3032119.1 sugar phosphate isomerase/epimerase [Niallia sp. MER 6]UPO90907.1 sugar phosphate isomerase/epimerase [Niallia sp. Man26]